MTPQSSGGAGRAIAAVLLALFAIIALSSMCSSGGKDEESRPSEAGAYVAAKGFVRDHLRAPSTAKFPCCYSDFTEDLGGGRYRIESYVDAENAFGAMIRDQYVVIVKWKGDDVWTLETIRFASD